MRRMIVGFGAGASEVRTCVQVYELTPERRRLVEDFSTTVKSARKPGMGPMVGVGAAASVVASAVVSGSVGLATAHGQTVEADAQHTAAAIAQELKKFFAEQGWIAPPSAHARAAVIRARLHPNPAPMAWAGIHRKESSMRHLLRCGLGPAPGRHRPGNLGVSGTRPSLWGAGGARVSARGRSWRSIIWPAAVAWDCPRPSPCATRARAAKPPRTWGATSGSCATTVAIRPSSSSLYRSLLWRAAMSRSKRTRQSSVHARYREN